MKKQGLFITATDTEVGKTQVTAIVGAMLQAAEIDFCVFKPAQTGVVRGKCPDLEEYKRYFRLMESEKRIIPVRFKAPQAPTIAADMEKRPCRVENILQSFYILKRHFANLLIEGIGGIHVPLTRKTLVSDFIKKTGLPPMVVTQPDLGTINHTCLTLYALKKTGIRPAGFVFNRVRKTGRLFRQVKTEIERVSGMACLGYVENFSRNISPAARVRRAQKTMDVKKIVSYFKK